MVLLDSIYGLAVAPDGLGIGTGSKDKSVRVWDVPEIALTSCNPLPHPGAAPEIQPHLPVVAILVRRVEEMALRSDRATMRSGNGLGGSAIADLVHLVAFLASPKSIRNKWRLHRGRRRLAGRLHQ
jgi:hypothetical protein